jgi:hypothetical protein
VLSPKTSYTSQGISSIACQVIKLLTYQIQDDVIYNYMNSMKVMLISYMYDKSPGWGHSQNKGPQKRQLLSPAPQFGNVHHPWPLPIIKT